MLKPVLLGACIVMAIGGTVAFRIAYARRAALRNRVSFWEAAAGTMWLRDDDGKVRWYVPVWFVFWLLVFAAIGVGTK